MTPVNITITTNNHVKIFPKMKFLTGLTHTHTQPFYGSVEFARENPGEPVPEETSLSAFSI